MDKLYRILVMYVRLTQGMKINKLLFCMEADCLPRSFDRDIQDIRNYLSDTYDRRELLYDRQENVYYFSGTHRTELERTEYRFIERILRDTGVLRKDEMEILLEHLLSNTERVSAEKILKHHYEEPFHKKALLKIHADLDVAIRESLRIRMRYTKADREYVEREVLPCLLRYDRGYMYLVAYLTDQSEEYPAYFRLDRIHSFEIIRIQTQEERFRVEFYNKRYSKGITQMYGGVFTEIELICRKEFYPYIHDQFRECEIIGTKENMLVVKIWAFDMGFVKWILSQPTDGIWVHRPENLRKKIAKEAKKILENYGGGI